MGGAVPRSRSQTSEATRWWEAHPARCACRSQWFLYCCGQVGLDFGEGRVGEARAATYGRQEFSSREASQPCAVEEGEKRQARVGGFPYLERGGSQGGRAHGPCTGTLLLVAEVGRACHDRCIAGMDEDEARRLPLLERLTNLNRLQSESGCLVDEPDHVHGQVCARGGTKDRIQ